MIFTIPTIEFLTLIINGSLASKLQCRRPCRGSQYFRDRPWLDTACGDVGTEAVYALRPAKDRKKDKRDKEDKSSRGGTAPAPPGGR